MVFVVGGCGPPMVITQQKMKRTSLLIFLEPQHPDQTEEQ